jgi:hypothetical protein
LRSNGNESVEFREASLPGYEFGRRGVESRNSYIRIVECSSAEFIFSVETIEWPRRKVKYSANVGHYKQKNSVMYMCHSMKGIYLTVQLKRFDKRDILCTVSNAGKSSGRERSLRTGTA